MLTPERQTCKILACAQARLTWGCSSAGRASRSQRGGRGFESHHLHHVFSAGQAIAWPVLFCMTKGFEPLRSIRVKKQPSGLFLANREEALADEVKRAKRDSESHHLHHVVSKAVLTNGLFICRCAEAQHSSLAFNRRSRTGSTRRSSFRPI